MVPFLSAKGLIAFLKIAVTVTLCYVILRSVDLAKFMHTISHVKPGFLVVVCLLYPFGLLISSIKLKWLLRGYDLRITVGAAFEANWISGFFNNFLPSSIGGDVYRLIYLNRSYPNMPAQTVSAIILDRGLGLLTMLILGALASAFFLGTLIQSTLVITALYCAVALVVLASSYVLFAPHDLRISHHTKSATVNRLINGLNILIRYPNKATLTRSFIVSLIYVVLIVASYYFMFLAFDSHVGPLILLFIIPVINLAGMIPISINALGITEGAGIFLFGRFGFEPELILSIFLTARILLMLCSATGGIPFMLRRR